MATAEQTMRSGRGRASRGPLLSRMKMFGTFAKRQPLGAFSVVVVLVLVLVAALANLIAPYDPIANNVGPSMAGPSWDHWLGTDNFGRDVFSRVIFGARTSLYVGLGATFVATFFATILGALSGYAGGILDYLFQRLVDVAQAIPALILLIGVVVVLGPSTTNVILAIALRFSLALSRVTRGAVMVVRDTPYIEATRSLGASSLRTLLLHVLPNIFPTVIVLISTSIGTVIVAEAGLSFLGYGVPPPQPSWGSMMSAEGRAYMLIGPWILIAPTIALGLVVFAMNMLGDAIRDELDPRMRGSR